MDKITIYDSAMTQSVTMPRVKKIIVGAKELSKTITMASGKIVKDMIGYRASVVAQWDWLPAETVSALAVLLHGGGFFYVEYPSPSGDASGMYEIDYPSMQVFGFKNGTAVWHDVKLSMTAQEVSA